MRADFDGTGKGNKCGEKCVRACVRAFVACAELNRVKKHGDVVVMSRDPPF